MPEQSHPPVTREFAGYRIKGQIGVGGMSDVYAAEDLSGNIDVALKLITPEHTQAYEDRDRQNARDTALFRIKDAGGDIGKSRCYI